MKNIPTKYLKTTLAVLVVIASVLLILVVRTFLKDRIVAVIIPTPIPTASPKLPTENTVSILLAGYGGPGHSGGGLADAIVLAHVNFDSNKIGLITIPRDTNVEIPVRSDLKELHKINDAFAIGGSDTNFPLKETKYKGEHGAGELLKVAVEKVTGITPDYYASVNFDNFVVIIDQLGGIEVVAPVAFKDSFFPVKGLENETCNFTIEEIDEFHEKFTGFELESQFTCRYEELVIEKGVNTLDGDRALKFIRSRHSKEHGGDFARGVRQQAMLHALKDKLISLEALRNLDDIYDQFKDMTTTDLGLGDALELVKKINDISEFEVINVNISEDLLDDAFNSEGQYVLNPIEGQGNFTEIQNYINATLGDG